MTPIQYRNAVAIDKEKLSVQAIIEDIKSCQHFNKNVPTDTKGLKKVLKEEYQPIIDMLNRRIDVLNEQLLAL